MKRKQPRDYQKDIIEQVVNSNKSTLIQIPTGGGKTFIAYEIATDLIAKFDQQVLFVAPRENLVRQTAEEFKFARPWIVHSSNKEDKNIEYYDFDKYPLLISTLQTAYRRKNIKPDVIIIDETHFGFDGKMISKLKESNKHSRIIGLSATPYDKYGKQLQGFDLILDKYDMKYMIKNKYLVPLKSYKRQKIKGLDKIKITQGDYDLAELEQVVCNNHTIMEIAETTKEKVEESNRTIVFAVTIKHADLLAEAYKKYGFTTRSLHSKSEENDKETIDYFKKGYIKVLVSVSKLTTGFDVPATDCAVIARPTKSQNLYKQMVGRILRLSPETHKTHAVLLDCGNVIDTLGDPLAPIKLMEPKESDNKLKCNVCESENLKLKKMKDGSFWECQACGHLKKIKEGIYKCNHCDNYSNKNSKFIITEKKIMLDCNFCKKKTMISEFLEDEELVPVDGENITSIQQGLVKDDIERLYLYIKNNNFIDFSKYYSELVQKYNINFNDILAYANNLGNEGYFGLCFKNSFSSLSHTMLEKSNTTKYFNLVDYLISTKNALEYIFLEDAIENNLINVEKHMLDIYDFSLELIFDTCFVEEENDLLHFCSYTLFNDDEIIDDELSPYQQRNQFFKRNSYRWKNFDATSFLSEYEDKEKEAILPYLDFYFGQYEIDITFYGQKNKHKFLPYIEAKTFVHKLQLNSYNEWQEYCNNKLSKYNPKPNKVPDDPQLIYKKEWKGIEDWLGIKSFLKNLEFTSDYFDQNWQNLPSYTYTISRKQLKKYSTISNTITDERIHEMITNLDFKNIGAEISGYLLDTDNKYINYHKNLLANPTISLEVKLTYILKNKKNKINKIISFIKSLDINISDIPQAKKIIHIFEETTNTLQYTPNIKNTEKSSRIIHELKEKLKNLVK